jgi:GNAT superfamily N-acetyltransferase
MKPLLDPDLVLFAEAGGKAVGFGVAIPDPNRLLHKLNGRIFPLGWLKALWYQRRIDQVTFKLFGVRKEYRRRGIDTLLYFEVIKAAAAKGYKWLDGSTTSEFNPAVVRMADRLGADRYKEFRLYQMTF